MLCPSCELGVAVRRLLGQDAGSRGRRSHSGCNALRAVHTDVLNRRADVDPHGVSADLGDGALQAVSQPGHQVHALMQDRHDQRGRAFARQAKQVVVPAVHHPQRRIDRAHVLERPVPGCKAGHGLLHPGEIAADLCVTPLLARMADDPTDVGFRRMGQNIIRPGQARPSSDSSSSRMACMPLVETFPASPASMRVRSRVFSSDHA